MKNILLFFNPHAGTQEYTKASLLAEVERIIPKDTTFTTYILEDESKRKEEVFKILKEKDWDLVIIGGGDGTIQKIVKVFIDEDLQFPTAILPLGSANGLSTCLGIADVEDALQAIQDRNFLHMDVLTINDEICLHLSDFGFNAGLVKKFEQSDERGMMSYFKGSLSEIFENKSYHFHLNLDGEELDVEARMLMIANGTQFGTGAVINPSGKMDDGFFEILAIQTQGWEEVISFSFHLLKGEPQEAAHVKYWRASKAIIRNPDEAVFQIDGDIKNNSKEIKVSILKNRLKIIQSFYS